MYDPLALDDECSDDDDDDGDFRELPPFAIPTKVAVAKQRIEAKAMVTGPSHFTAEAMEDPWVSDNDPWNSSSSASQPTSVLPVPSSWNYEFDKKQSAAATEINWEVNSSVTDRIMREIEEMRSQIPVTPTNTPATTVAAGEENQTIDSPPGLVANRKLENGLSQGISVYRGMLDRSVESETYRSPAMQSGMSANASHYGLATPVSDMSCNEVGVQTECTLAIGLDRIVWEPKLVNAVTEPKITGVDAKLEFAVRAQEADVLPERTVNNTNMGVGDSDEDEAEDEIDIGDRAGDGADNIVGIVGLGKTLENTDMDATMADTA